MSYLNFSFDLNDKNFVDFYDELPLWSAAFGLKLLDKIEYKKELKVLDIGSGIGFPIIELSQRLDKSSRIIGIEPWELACKKIKKKLKYYKIKNVEIINSKIEDIIFPEESFDLILSNNGLNNVDDMLLSLRICNTALKKNGKLVFTMNLNTTMLEFYHVFETVLVDLNLIDEMIILKEHINKKRKPLDYMFKIIERANFKVKSIDYDSFKYAFSDGSSFLNHYFIKVAFLDSWKKIVNPENIEIVFKEIERRLNSISEKIGHLEFSIPFVCFECQRG